MYILSYHSMILFCQQLKSLEASCTGSGANRELVRREYMCNSIHMPGKNTQKGKNFSSPLFLAAIIVLILVSAGFFLKQEPKQEKKSTPHTQQTQSDIDTLWLLANAALWYPSLPWSPPTKATTDSPYGKLSGNSIHATVTKDTPMVDHFEDVNALAEKGFLPDTTLAADGPGSSTWGYKKEEGNSLQVIIFSYRTQPTNSNPNEPVQFTCPCKIDITTFVSTPFSR